MTPGYADDKSSRRRLSEERAEAAAGLGGTGGASRLLEPGNELLEGDWNCVSLELVTLAVRLQCTYIPQEEQQSQSQSRR